MVKKQTAQHSSKVSKQGKINKNKKDTAPQKHSKNKHKTQTHKQTFIDEQQPLVETAPKVEYSYTVGHLEPEVQLESLYTGGKIMYSAPYFYSICEYKIYVWDPNTSQIIQKIHHEGEEIANFTINIDCTIIATYTTNNLLRLLDIKDNYSQITVLKLPHYFPIDMAISPNKKYLALGCVNSHVKILSVPGLKQTHDHKSHVGSLRKIEWHPQQLLLNSIDQNGLFVVFDVVKNKAIHKIQGFGSFFGLTKSGNNIVSIGDWISVIDGKNFKSQYRVQLQQPTAEVMCLFGKGPFLLFGGENRPLTVMNLNDSNHQIMELDGLYEGILTKIMSLSQSTIALITSEQNISIVQFENGKFNLLKTILGYNDQILDIKFSKSEGSDPNLIAMATNSSLIKLYNTKTQQTKLISGHKQIVLGLSYVHPWLASGGKDNLIKLWRIDTPMEPRLVATYKGHSADVTNIAIGLNSSQIASVSEDKTIKLWILQDFESAKIVKNASTTVMAHDKSANSVKWSPDQQLIASCSQDKLIKIWSKTLEHKMTLKGHRRGVWDIIFHPNQKILSSVSADGSLKVWNLVTGECISTMGEGQAILKAQWIFNNQVVTATADGILRLWDIRKNTSISFDNHVGRIWGMDVSPPDQNNKCRVVTAGVDSKILLWKDLTEEKRLQAQMSNEKKERTKLTYQLAIQKGQYEEAAKLAFRQGYDELFIKAIENIHSNFSQKALAKVDNQQITFENQKIDSSSDLQGLVKELISLDLVKLLKILMNLNGISRYFKISNRLLHILLGKVAVSGILSLDKNYNDQKRKGSLDDFNRKESDFQNFLSRFQSYNEKHSRRLDGYAKKSYWMDYQSQKRI